MMSSPMHRMFFHGMTMSLFPANMLSLLVVPGTMIDVITPLSKSAVTS